MQHKRQLTAGKATGAAISRLTLTGNLRNT